MGTARSAYQKQLAGKLRDTLLFEESRSGRVVAEKRQLEESFDATFARLDREGDDTGQPVEVSRRVTDTKWTTSDPNVNRYYVNYGTMLDFFDYSGVRLQAAKRYCDLRRPTSFGFVLMPDD